MLFGLVIKRTAWCLTWRAWLAAAIFGSAALLVLIQGGASFLCATEPVEAQVLIVEGWLPDYALKDAGEEFARGKYRYVLTAGGPLLGGYYLSGGKTSAELAALSLIRFGVASNLVVPVPGPPGWRERGLLHAVAVRQWIAANAPELQKVNVYSLGVHARRTRLLFQQVLGPEIKVGIIAHPDNAFVPGRWWTSSEGVRTVLSELHGYLWMRLFGRP